MVDTSPVQRFLHTLAAAVSRDGEERALARGAAGALEEILSDRSSFVIDVQFTGFTEKGVRVGGVDPGLLRFAGHLITLRVQRLGFTREARAEDLSAFFSAVSVQPRDLPDGGLIAVLAEHHPFGIYVATTTGAYRPAKRAAPPDADGGQLGKQRYGDEDAAASTAVPGLEVEDEVELTDFELLDVTQQLASIPEAPSFREPREDSAEVTDRRDDSGLYQFFRSSGSAPEQSGVRELADRLPATTALPEYSELLAAAAFELERLMADGDEEDALLLLTVFVDEVNRTDRSRVYRDTARTTFLSMGRGKAVPFLMGLLERRPEGRDRFLPLLVEFGSEAAPLLEALLFRTADTALRETAFLALSGQEVVLERILERALNDPQSGRARGILELAMLPELEPAIALRWIGAEAAHQDPGLRAEAARHAARLGGRTAMRILMELLNDSVTDVQVAALRGLGALHEPTSVPFVARLVRESSDEEVQLAAIEALGRIGSAEAMPPLASVLNRRQLLGARKLARLKVAAVRSLARIPSRPARDLLHQIASGKETEISSEAMRLLALSAAGEEP
jgi:hypothetical protein